MNENEQHFENRGVTVDEGVAERFRELFGEKIIDGKKLNVEETIATLSIELDGEIQKELAQRHAILESRAAVGEKFALPRWDDTFQDAVNGDTRTFREIVQGMIDNFLGRKTELAWRLNDTVPIPADANPLSNPGLELTGPWYPLDMAIKQINADVSAMMGPDDEDAAPADYVPTKKKDNGSNEPVGLFLSRVNERRLLAGEIKETTMRKKGQSKTYKIEKPREEWPTSFHRVPGIHLRTEKLKVNGRPAPAIIADYVIHALNDHGSLKRTGSGLYYYQPKIQTPSEALIVAKLVWGLERLMGAKEPGSIIKFKALYEEASAGRYLPIIMWIWRYWLIGTNVGRWDYTGSLIEIWKNERVLPDPQNGSLMGMTSPHMMTYQKYNALLNVMAGVNSDGKLTNGAPIGGMAAAMLYSETDPYGRARHNPVTLRAIKMDKIRERLIGLIFVPDDRVTTVEQATLSDILEGRVKGRLYDAYRMSWVASPDREYVGAGSGPLRVSIQELQAMLDTKVEWVEMEDGKPRALAVASGLTQDERRVLISLGLLNQNGQITPWVVTERAISDPEKFFEKSILWGRKDLWNSLYEIPKGEVTIENIQHAFYMCANYGFQVLNGNLAAAIDDYKLVPNHVVRFMNDLATYRIFVGWLWVVCNREAGITKTGWLKKPRVTHDGVIPIDNAVELKEGAKFTRVVFRQLVELHNEWTKAFFEDYDRYAAVRLVSSIILERHKNYRLQHQSIEKMAQLLLTVHGTEQALHDIANFLDIEPPALEVDTKLVDLVPRIKSILSDAYGKAPTSTGEISRQEAAAMIAKLLGAIKEEEAVIESEIEASAPRFDRSKARIIMDVLKRQLVSPLYIQHSPRVLFVIADKDDETRERILDAIYYVDKDGNPIFRDSGEPSRKKVVEAALRGIVPNYAVEAHDYVHDVIHHTSQ